MADTKANIMVGVSALIFTSLLAHTRLEGFTLATGILAVSTVMAATAAIIAVMPATQAPKRGTKSFNPLFFGCFSPLPREEYCREIENILKDEQSIYTAFAMDIYGIGKVLYQRKYRFLAYSYRIFLAGLLLSFLAGIFSR